MKNGNDILNLVDSTLRYLGQRYLDGVLPYMPKIEETLNMFSDEESKNLYGREICYCILSNFLRKDLPSRLSGLMTQDHWNNCLKETERRKIHHELLSTKKDNWVLNYCKTATFLLGQYEYKNKVRIQPGDVCLDVGACLGDSSIWMCDNGAKESWAFEIDRDNLEIIAKNATVTGYGDKIHICPYAASSSPGKTWYVPNNSNVGGGKVSEQAGGGYEVDCVALDDFCEDKSIVPDFVKMDIEGAELQAIQGAKNIFLSNRPKFAICIYHKWDHRWTVPLTLKELCEDYEFYLKKSHPECETVIMGIPRERKTQQLK